MHPKQDYVVHEHMNIKVNDKEHNYQDGESTPQLFSYQDLERFQESEL